MAVSAIVPGLVMAAVALGLGAIVRPGVGLSAAIGVVVGVGGFSAQVLALGWARTAGPNANLAVALFGFLVLLGVVGGLYALLRATGDWFSPAAFGGGLLALVPIAIYETWLVRKGRIGELIVDHERAASAAAASAKERG
jgi:hypothetical protein